MSVPKRCAAANPVMLSNTDLTIKRVWELELEMRYRSVYNPIELRLDQLGVYHS